MNIAFIDKNESLVKKVKNAVKHLPFKVKVECGDIFKEKGVIISASNPDYTFGGGLDAAIYKKFPEACELARKHKGENYSEGRDVIFTITVNDELKATRELVASALKFALDEKNHMRPDETILVSGLGTGIGGLDEDDFVWLFLQGLCESHDYGWGIKYLNKYGTDHRTGKIAYKSGVWLEQSNAPKNGEDCGVGLHLGKSLAGAGNYCLPEKIMFCLYEKKDFCGEGDDKIRVSRLLPLTELPEWLGYGLNGKKIVNKTREKIDPEKYNPYQATKLPTKNEIKNTKLTQVWDQVGDQVWDQVWDQVGDQVGDQVWDQVWDQVRAQVWDQVRDQVWDQVGDQVWDQVWDQVRAQVWDQVRDQVGAQVGAQVRDQVGAQVGAQVRDQVGAQVGAQVRAQVRDQVRAASYWAIGVYFDLGLSHWFGDLLKLGVMVVFVKGKVKFFGKKGIYLGEYDESELA